MRNALAHANKNGRRMVSAFIATAFAQETADAAGSSGAASPTSWPKLPKLAALIDEAEVDVLAFMNFPKEHWAKISSTNPSSGPTARSNAGPTSSAFSPTKTPSSVSSAPSCWSRTTIGPSSAQAT